MYHPIECAFLAPVQASTDRSTTFFAMKPPQDAILIAPDDNPLLQVGARIPHSRPPARAIHPAPEAPAGTADAPRRAC